MFRTLLIICCALLLLASCRHGGRRHVTSAFYHWKTKVDLTAADSAMLHETGSRRLYVNFFDVVPNEDWQFSYPALPGAETRDIANLPHDVEIVPVVYVTNDAMKKMDSASIPMMADKICRKVNRFLTLNGFDTAREMQMDCDWTNSTRDKYFYLLTQIRAKGQLARLSATIRLYQYKYYKKTGVPPVDRGVLMFYHMNAVRDFESKELILDVAEGQKYLTGSGYPLKLDFALPLFSELLVNGYPGVSFYSASSLKRLTQDSSLVAIDSMPGWYDVKKEVQLGKETLRRWQEVKLETAHIADLQKASDLLSAKANTDTFEVIFFHLDQDANSPYTTHEVKDLIRRFD